MLKVERVLAELVTLTPEELREVRRWLVQEVSRRRYPEGARPKIARALSRKLKRDLRIDALKAEGLTIRQVAVRIGMSSASVHRRLHAHIDGVKP